MKSGHRVRVAVFGALGLALGSGCNLIQKAADVPGQAVRTVTPTTRTEPVVDLVDVQQDLMRFADEFTSRMIIGIDKLYQGSGPVEQAARLRWKIAFGTATCTIASGPNTVANLLDMTVFVTEARMSLEEHWQPKVFGESAQPAIDGCRLAEAELWRLTDKVLKPEQQVALREAMLEWHRLNTAPENLLSVRAVGLALQVTQVSRSGTAKPGNLLGLLMLDPLAELDPARRELAETRLFAERALFVMQKMPLLVRWQTELLTLNALGHPTLQQWSTNVVDIAASVDRFTRAAERLPQQIGSEREAILKALESQERDLLPVLGEARQALAAGTQTAAELNTALLAFDGVLKRLGVGEPDDDAGDKRPSEPFRIQDYGQVANQLETAAKQLTELLQTFDQTLGQNSREALAAQVGPVVEQARAGGKELADDVFRKALLLVLAVLLAALIYRVLSVWIGRCGGRASVGPQPPESGGTRQSE